LRGEDDVVETLEGNRMMHVAKFAIFYPR
jgi:hypothetical protein